METQRSASLAPHTTLKLGGPAERFVTVETEEELLSAVRAADASASPTLILAGGSNVVIGDEGFPGTVVHVRTRGTELRELVDGRVEATVQAGEPWDEVVSQAVANGLAGIEALSGIPGAAGATPIQNVGAYGQEISETLTSVRAYDRHTDQVVRFTNDECGFDYRSSRFRGDDRYVVLTIALSLLPGRITAPPRYPELARELGLEAQGSDADPDSYGPLPDPAEVRKAVLALRRRKGMVIDPEDPDSVSAGSFFKNPILGQDDFERLDQLALTTDTARTPPRFPAGDGLVKTSAAWLIEGAGFHKGYTRGRVGISAKHALALVNRGGASTVELLALADEITATVERQFGVALEPEPILINTP